MCTKLSLLIVYLSDLIEVCFEPILFNIMGHGSSIQSSSKVHKGRILQTTLNAAQRFKAGNRRTSQEGPTAGGPTGSGQLDLTVTGSTACGENSKDTANKSGEESIQQSEKKSVPQKKVKKKGPAPSNAKKKSEGTTSKTNARRVSVATKKNTKQINEGGKSNDASNLKHAIDKNSARKQSNVQKDGESVLHGAVDQNCPLNTKLIRIFISSTFTDTEHERNALMEKVYPKLKSHCKEYGYEFQVVDMRWGVRDEVTDLHETIDFCTREIKACQQLSCGPNFITLLADKYGYCPIPPRIEAQEFEEILSAFDDENIIEMFHKWYRKDLNAIPPSYVLQPVTTWYPDYFSKENKVSRDKSRQEWWTVFEELKRSLLTAVRMVFDSEEKIHRYVRSVSEAEIEEGILKSSVDTSKCGWFHRQFTGLEHCSQDTNIVQYVDRTETGQDGVNIRQLQDNLKNEIAEALGGRNVSTYTVKWNDEKGIDPDTEEHKTYLETFCSDFENMLRRMITKSINENKNSAIESPLYEEVCQHALFCQGKIQMFHGRKQTLQSICEYIKGSSHSPLVLYGRSGCGKTSIIAKTAQLVQEWTKSKPCVILRFLGTTAKSSSIRRLLNSVLQQIKTVYHLNTKVPKGTKSLMAALPLFLSSAKEHKPLIILFDSLDQLSPSGGARQLSWLPTTLPKHVKFVVSTLPNAEFRCYPKLRAVLKDPKLFIEVPNLPENDVRDILTKWLKSKNRCLQPDQLKSIETAFEQCPLPLFLKISFDEACLWQSYMPPDQTRLQVTIRDAINSLFERNERVHGELLVRHALGYITAARSGLTTNELEDILSCNDTVLDDIFQYWTPPIRRLPPLIWLRIRADFESYLVYRGAEGARVTNWYHRQFTEAARARYLSDDRQRITLHSHIAEYFMGQTYDPTDAPSTKGKVGFSRLSSVAAQPLKLSRNQYNLRKLHELPYHLIISEQWQLLKDTVLCNYVWLEAKMRVRSLRDVLEDFHHAMEGYIDQDIADVNEILELGKNAIVSDPSQLSSQLVSRLYDKQVQDSSSLVGSPLSDTLRKLLRDAHNPEEPSLLPNRAFLTPPGGQLVRTLVGHKTGVYGLAVSRDGKYLVTGSQDGSVKVWSIKDGALLVTVEDLGEEISAVQCCYDDKRIVVSSKRGLTVLDLDTGEILQSLKIKYFDHSPPFSMVGPKGAIAVFFTENSLKSFNILIGKVSMNITDIRPVGQTGQNSLLASYQNTVLCNSDKDENSLNLIDVHQGKVVKSFIVFDSEDDESFLNLTDIAMRQANEVIVAKKMRVDLYELENGTKIKSIRCKLDDWITHVSILPESDKLAFPKRNNVALLDLNTEERREVSDPSDYISRTLVAAEDVIVTSSGDSVVRIWDLTRKDVHPQMGKVETLLHIYTFPTDSRHVITVGRLGIDNHVITTWDMSTFLPVSKVHNISSSYLKIIGDRRAALRVNNHVAIVDISTWKVVRILKGKIADFMYAGTPDICLINHRKELLVYACDQKSLQIYDVETGDETGELIGPRQEHKIQAFIVNDEGTVLAHNDEPLDIIYIWDVIKREMLFPIQRTGYLRYVLSVAEFLPSGKSLTVALRRTNEDDYIRHPSVWSVKTKERVHDLRFPDDTDAQSLAIINDSKAMTSHKDASHIVIWDLVRGVACHIIPSMHYGRRIDVLSSGGRFAVSHDDKTIELWDVEDGKQVSSFTGDKLSSVQPLYDGDVVAVGCDSPLPLVVLKRQGRNLPPFECPAQGSRAMSFGEFNINFEGIDESSID